MALTAEQQAEIDAAITKVKADLQAEFAKEKSALEVWVNAHPVLAFRVGTVLGIIGGGFTVFAVLHFL